MRGESFNESRLSTSEPRESTQEDTFEPDADDYASYSDASEALWGACIHIGARIDGTDPGNTTARSSKSSISFRYAYETASTNHTNVRAA